MGWQQILPDAACPTVIIRHWWEIAYVAHMFLLRIPDEQPHIRRPEIKVLHRMELQPIGRDIQGILEGFLSISIV